MLTRRGFASCAICAITGFIATDASAQGAAPAGGVTRNILSKTDGPAAGYETLLVEAIIEAGVAVGQAHAPGDQVGLCHGRRLRASHPGSGDPHVEAGRRLPDSRANTPHAGGKAGTAKTRLIITYLVEKGKPLASPV